MLAAEKQIIDAVALTQSTDERGCQVVRVKNVSTKDISAYSIVLRKVRSDNSIDIQHMSADYLTRAISSLDNGLASNGWFHPQEETIAWTYCPGGPDAAKSVTGEAEAVLFIDGTSQGTSDSLIAATITIRRDFAASDNNLRSLLTRSLATIAQGETVSMQNVRAEIERLEGEGLILEHSPTVQNLKRASQCETQLQECLQRYTEVLKNHEGFYAMTRPSP